MRFTQRESGSAQVITIIILIAGILGVIGVVFWKNFVNQPSGTTNQQVTASTTTPASSSLTTLHITELGIGLPYDKTLPTISYDIQKTDSGTRYAQLSNATLVGTTCTGDTGNIAAVILNPTQADTSTPFVATVTIDSNKYVLTLSGSNCTNNKSLLTKYQDSIEKNFIHIVQE